MQRKIDNAESGVIVEEGESLSFVSLCRYCTLPAETIIKMVDRGMIEPIDPKIAASHWQFPSSSLLRVKMALRLQRDLDVNLSGAALAIELFDEIKRLRQQLSLTSRWGGG